MDAHDRLVQQLEAHGLTKETAEAVRAALWKTNLELVCRESEAYVLCEEPIKCTARTFAGGRAGILYELEGVTPPVRWVEWHDKTGAVGERMVV